MSRRVFGRRPVGDYWWWLVTHTIYRRFFASIGSRSIVRAPLMLRGTGSARLGRGCLIRDHSRIEFVPFPGDRAGPPTLIIGDGVAIEQDCHITCGQRIVIGNNVAITERVGIFDIWHGYEEPTQPVAWQALRTAPVEIGDDSFIGIGAVIQPGVTIGRHCVIGANSVVTRSIPDFAVAVGAPAKVIRRMEPSTGAWYSVTKL